MWFSVLTFVIFRVITVDLYLVLAIHQHGIYKAYTHKVKVHIGHHGMQTYQGAEINLQTLSILVQDEE
jgi:hypothetical protein